MNSEIVEFKNYSLFKFLLKWEKITGLQKYLKKLLAHFSACVTVHKAFGMASL
jgi:hypothetical protein